MKSLYLAIVLAMVVILAAAVVVYSAISQSMVNSYFNPVFDHMDEVEVQEASEIFHSSGPEALTAYMHRLDSVFGGSHYLLDANGRDVLTGLDRSHLLPPPPAVKSRGTIEGMAVVTHRSQDGSAWFVATTRLEQKKAEFFHYFATAPLRAGSAPLYQYYLLVVGAIVLLCWLAAVYVVSPLRGIAAGIRRFGEGDLSLRLPVHRSDEIGTLSTSFNRMAERIQTLFLSEQRLLADVSHELRSPLARLQFSVKLARTAPDRDASLDRIKRDIDRLSTLVSGLMEMTRAEADPLHRIAEEVSIDALVASILHDSRIEIEARGGEIRLTGASGIVVHGNSELLRRAVENVLRNAIRHSPEGSPIDVQLQLRDRHVCIAIRDYGTGIPDALLDRIFDPFFRVDECRTPSSGGVGLGLSIAKRAVQLHGGCIRARNAAPGLLVEIELPISAALAQPADSAPVPAAFEN